jgi:hypothetical protein
MAHALESRRIVLFFDAETIKHKSLLHRDLGTCRSTSSFTNSKAELEQCLDYRQSLYLVKTSLLEPSSISFLTPTRIGRTYA